MKSIPPAVQAALHIYLATAGIKVSVWSHLQIPYCMLLYRHHCVHVGTLIS